MLLSDLTRTWPTVRFLQNVYFRAIQLTSPALPVHVFRISMHVENGVSSLREAACSRLRLGTGEIEDAKFVDDDILMVLWAGQGAS